VVGFNWIISIITTDSDSRRLLREVLYCRRLLREVLQFDDDVVIMSILWFLMVGFNWIVSIITTCFDNGGRPFRKVLHIGFYQPVPSVLVPNVGSLYIHYHNDVVILWLVIDIGTCRLILC
jgi:hypothetical protein